MDKPKTTPAQTETDLSPEDQAYLKLWLQLDPLCFVPKTPEDVEMMCS